MPEEHRNIGEEYQRLSKAGFDASVRSFAEVNKGFQALSAEMTDYSKRAFDDGGPCLGAVSRCEVARSGVRNSVPVRKTGIRQLHVRDVEAWRDVCQPGT
jgi:hypothetical protein